MSETGVVKFDCEHLAVELAHFAELEQLNACRRKLLQLRMIGVDAHGIGYGNLSVRAGDTNQFYITGSGTGHRAKLSLDDIAKVTACDFGANWLRCEGRTVASSESLTHAAVYEAESEARAVIHVHADALWRRLVASGIATSADVEYGTPEIAFAVQRLFRDSDVRDDQIFAMAGHLGGIVAFGHHLQHAFEALIRQLRDAPSS